VRLATFNVLHGRSVSDDQVDADRFADAVASLDADVLALQEVDRDQERSHGLDLTATAAEAMGASNFRFAAAMAGAPDGGWQKATGDEPVGSPLYGVALLSRFPVRRWDVIRLPALRLPVAFRWPGNSWPSLVRDESRVALVAEVVAPPPLGALTVVATHLSFLPGWNDIQLRMLMHQIRRMTGPVVLMGDLNLEPEHVQRTTGLRSLGAADTFPAQAPTRQIDHVLARDVPGRPTAQAITLPVSDHAALVVDLA
jgi:endonuclease/exonuclease/phosphatase family metal-dependent hydrolase